MAKRGEFQTPFDGAMPTPDLGGSGVTQRGGAELGEGTRKETENSVSGLPTLPDRYTPGEGDPGTWGTVPLPSLTEGAGRTIKTGK